MELRKRGEIEMKNFFLSLQSDDEKFNELYQAYLEAKMKLSDYLSTEKVVMSHEKKTAALELAPHRTAKARKST